MEKRKHELTLKKKMTLIINYNFLPQKSVLKQYIDEGSVVLAEFYAQNGEVPKALKYLEEVKSPEGLFVKAHVSRKEGF